MPAPRRSRESRRPRHAAPTTGADERLAALLARTPARPPGPQRAAAGVDPGLGHVAGGAFDDRFDEDEFDDITDEDHHAGVAGAAPTAAFARWAGSAEGRAAPTERAARESGVDALFGSAAPDGRDGDHVGFGSAAGDSVDDLTGDLTDEFAEFDEDDEWDGRRRGPGESPGLVRTPSALVGASARAGRWSIVGLVAALVLAAGGVGAWAWQVRGDAAAPADAGATHVAAPTRTSAPGFGKGGGAAPAGATGGATATAGATVGATATAGAPSGTVAVHVVGAVRRPGVVRLPGGARVDDAVKAAGGASPKADLGSVNLARPVADGEQIVVAVRGARPATAAGAPGASGATAAPGGSGGSAAGGVVDLNTADLAALDGLPGVGPVLAQRILDWRTQHGRFTSVEQLGDVQGVGDKTLARLTPHVRV